MEDRMVQVLAEWNLSKPTYAHSMRYATDVECKTAGVPFRQRVQHQNPRLGKRRHVCDDCNSGPRLMQHLHCSICKGPKQLAAAEAHGTNALSQMARRKLVSSAFQTITKDFNDAAKVKRRRIGRLQEYVRNAACWAGSAALQY